MTFIEGKKYIRGKINKATRAIEKFNREELNKKSTLLSNLLWDKFTKFCSERYPKDLTVLIYNKKEN